MNKYVAGIMLSMLIASSAPMIASAQSYYPYYPYPYPQGASLVATPNYGQAPLTVTFSGQVSGMEYKLDFGDGSTPVFRAQEILCPMNNQGCGVNATLTVDNTHTYTSAGTYAAVLTGSNGQYSTQTITVANTAPTPPTPYCWSYDCNPYPYDPYQYYPYYYYPYYYYPDYYDYGYQYGPYDPYYYSYSPYGNGYYGGY